MLEGIQLSYPSYYIFACIVLALLFAIGLYFKEQKFKSVNPWLAYALSALRFLSVLGLLLLLLNPVFKHFQEQVIDPIILIAEDKSQSISAVLKEEESKELNASIENLSQSLSNEYAIKRISFGDRIRNEVNDSFGDQTTNLSQLIQSIDANYGDQNLGAIIISSDGIYNEGRNPIYEDYDFKAPIYTIAVGDTSVKKDLVVSNLLHNRIAYYGDRFSVQVDVQAFNSVGEKSRISIHKLGGKNPVQLAEKVFTISSNSYFKTFDFELEAGKVGNVSYQVRLDPVSDESSSSNNRKRFYMEVLDERQKIVLIANAPHPDVSAIRQLLDNNKNYEFELKFRNDDMGNLLKKDIVIFHNLPSKSFAIDNILNQIKKNKTPILYIIGNQSSLTRFNANQEAMKITGNNSNQNEAQALVAPNFNLFLLDDNIGKKLQEFVPLSVPYGEYTLHPKASVLLNQKIGNIDTKYPLVVFHEQSNQKLGIIAGEGLWRWKLYEYAQYQEETVNREFISKLIQYLSKKEDRRRFRAYTSKNNYKENESIYLDAQLYNPNFELVNDADAFLEISDENGKKFEYTFSKTNNYYKLDAGRFSAGKYSYNANVLFNGEKYNARGAFVVETVQKELYDLTAKHNILYSLSDKSGGTLHYLDQIQELESKILEAGNIKPLLLTNSVTEKLLNLKWLALIIAFLLFIEWFLRRFYGHY